MGDYQELAGAAYPTLLTRGTRKVLQLEIRDVNSDKTSFILYIQPDELIEAIAFSEEGGYPAKCSYSLVEPKFAGLRPQYIEHRLGVYTTTAFPNEREAVEASIALINEIAAAKTPFDFYVPDSYVKAQSHRVIERHEDGSFVYLLPLVRYVDPDDSNFQVIECQLDAYSDEGVRRKAEELEEHLKDEGYYIPDYSKRYCSYNLNTKVYPSLYTIFAEKIVT